MEFNHASAPSHPGISLRDGLNEAASHDFPKERHESLTREETREFEVLLDLAGFTDEMKRAIIHSPGNAAATAMYNAVIALTDPSVNPS